MSYLRLFSMRLPTDVRQQIPYRISSIENNTGNKSSQGQTKSQRLSLITGKCRTTIDKKKLKSVKQRD